MARISDITQARDHIQMLHTELTEERATWNGVDTDMALDDIKRILMDLNDLERRLTWINRKGYAG